MLGGFGAEGAGDTKFEKVSDWNIQIVLTPKTKTVVWNGQFRKEIWENAENGEANSWSNN